MKKCVYCDTNEGTRWIPNPNFDESEKWGVCQTCEIIVRFQQRMTLAIVMGDFEEAGRIQDEINQISEKEGIPTCMFIIKKRGDRAA